MGAEAADQPSGLSGGREPPDPIEHRLIDFTTKHEPGG